MAAFTYERFSEAALAHVKATSVLAHADGMPATPDHLRRALESTPAPALWERWKDGSATTHGQFTPELTSVLRRAFEAADGAVEPADLAAALRRSPKLSEDPEAWAREHVRVDVADFAGTDATWIARLEVDGLVFEHRERGDVTERRALRQRATDAVIADFLDSLDRNRQTD